MLFCSMVIMRVSVAPGALVDPPSLAASGVLAVSVILVVVCGCVVGVFFVCCGCVVGVLWVCLSCVVSRNITLRSVLDSPHRKESDD